MRHRTVAATVLAFLLGLAHLRGWSTRLRPQAPSHRGPQQL